MSLTSHPNGPTDGISGRIGSALFYPLLAVTAYHVAMKGWLLWTRVRKDQMQNEYSSNFSVPEDDAPTNDAELTARARVFAAASRHFAAETASRGIPARSLAIGWASLLAWPYMCSALGLTAGPAVSVLPEQSGAILLSGGWILLRFGGVTTFCGVLSEVFYPEITALSRRRLSSHATLMVLSVGAAVSAACGWYLPLLAPAALYASAALLRACRFCGLA